MGRGVCDQQGEEEWKVSDIKLMQEKEVESRRRGCLVFSGGFSIFSNSLNIPLSERKAEVRTRARKERTKRTDFRPGCPSALSGQHVFVHIISVASGPAQKKNGA